MMMNWSHGDERFGVDDDGNGREMRENVFWGVRKFEFDLGVNWLPSISCWNA